jgi:hypothetical protein
MPRHRHREFRRFLKTVDERTLPHLDIHLIVDNHATHKTPRGNALTQACRLGILSRLSVQRCPKTCNKDRRGNDRRSQLRRTPHRKTSLRNALWWQLRWRAPMAWTLFFSVGSSAHPSAISG